MAAALRWLKTPLAVAAAVAKLLHASLALAAAAVLLLKTSQLSCWQRCFQEPPRYAHALFCWQEFFQAKYG